MNKILIVSPTPFAPANAGNRERIKALVESLARQGHCVHFAHVTREDGDAAAMRALLDGRFHTIQYQPPESWRRAYRKMLAHFGLASAHRYGLDEWYDGGIEQPIADLVRRHEIDTVMVEYVFMSKLLTVLPGTVTKVLDTHDVFSERHQRFIEHGITPAWFSCSAADEAKALSRADKVIAIQDQEADYFRTLTNVPVVTVGHAAEVARNYQRSSHPEDLLYVGSKNPINLASLNWFLDKVMPGVHKQVGRRLKVVGSICEVVRSNQYVESVGRVEDLASVYRTAAVAINPSVMGTGLKIKTIEALAHACPVVATANAAEGFEAAQGRGLFVSDDPEEFQHHVVRLLTDAEWNQEMSSCARHATEAYHLLCQRSLQAAFAHCAG